MSEPTLLDRTRAPIRVKPGQARQVSPRDLAVRFAFGVVASVGSGVMSLAFGPRAGGLFLAFPAILAASLTLIARDEDVAEAREDARGAVVGAVGLGSFAATGALLFAELAGGLVLALATLGWALVAVGLYLLVWRPRAPRRERLEAGSTAGSG